MIKAHAELGDVLKGAPVEILAAQPGLVFVDQKVLGVLNTAGVVGEGSHLECNPSPTRA